MEAKSFLSIFSGESFCEWFHEEEDNSLSGTDQIPIASHRDRLLGFPSDGMFNFFNSKYLNLNTDNVVTEEAALGTMVFELVVCQKICCVNFQ